MNLSTSPDYHRVNKAKSEYHLERGKSNSHIKLKSLIMAQIERWRNALHMQVERQHGLRSGGEWRTGE
jgi:hypothetical protein